LSKQSIDFDYDFEVIIEVGLDDTVFKVELI